MLSNTEYRIEATYTYDLNDGEGNQELVVVHTIKTIKIVPQVLIEFQNVAQTTIDYLILINDIDYSINSYELYADIILFNDQYPYANLVTERISLTELNGTLSNLNTYSIHKMTVNYQYDLNDGNGAVNHTIYQTVRTAKRIDDFGLFGSIIGKDSLTFTIWEIDFDGVVNINLKYELYNHDKSILVSSEFDQEPEMLWGWINEYNHTFTNLLSNNDYYLVLTYQYDLGDANGVQEAKYEFLLTTLPKATPELNITNVVPTQGSIGFELDITDVDEVGEVTKISLYQGETLVETLTDLTTREFNNLLSNTEYRIEVTYTYDLNDGYGTRMIGDLIRQYPLVSHKPYFDDIVMVKISDIYVFEPIEGWFIIDWMLNDGESEFLAENVPVEYHSQYMVGDIITSRLIIYPEATLFYLVYQFDFDAIIKHDEFNPYILDKPNSTVTTLVNNAPEMFIENVMSTQDSILFDINITDVDEVGAMIAIELYHGQTLIESLSDLNAREFTSLLANKEYTIKVTYKYDLNDGTGEVLINILVDVITPLFNGEGTESNPFLINNINDLKNLGFYGTSVYYYDLSSNIDLDGVNWEPIEIFHGVLNGNGYSIENLKMNYNVTIDDTVQYGLFAASYGIIKNVGFVNVDIEIINNHYYGNVYTGTIAAYNEGTIENCYVYGKIKSYSESTNLAGGAVGLNMGLIEYVYVDVLMDGGNNNTFVGGIIGSHYGMIKNSVAIGDVTYTSLSDWIYSASVAGFGHSGRFENVYRYEFQQVTGSSYWSAHRNEVYGISIVTQTQLYSIDWFIDVLKLDTNIWDLTSVGQTNNSLILITE